MWGAGWAVAGRERREGRLRKGVIFVKGGEEVEWLKSRIEGKGGEGGEGRGRGRMVHVVRLDQAERRGEFDLSEGSEWVFF